MCCRCRTYKSGLWRNIGRGKLFWNLFSKFTFTYRRFCRLGIAVEIRALGKSLVSAHISAQLYQEKGLRPVDLILFFWFNKVIQRKSYTGQHDIWTRIKRSLYHFCPERNFEKLKFLQSDLCGIGPSSKEWSWWLAFVGFLLVTEEGAQTLLA